MQRITIARLVMALLLLSTIACNKEMEDDGPDFLGDLLITGKVQHEVTEQPIEGVEVLARLNFEINSTAISDAEGNYEILFLDIPKLYENAGFSQGEVDTILSSPISLEVAPQLLDCEWVRVDPRETYDLFIDLPTQQNGLFSLSEGGTAQFTFLDTATVARDNPIHGIIELRQPTYQEPYEKWVPLEYDLFDGISANLCLPYDLPVEATITIQEYTLDPTFEVLNTITQTETLILLAGETVELEIQY